MKSAHPPPNYFFRAGRSKMPKEADNQNSKSLWRFGSLGQLYLLKSVFVSHKN